MYSSTVGMCKQWYLL